MAGNKPEKELDPRAACRAHGEQSKVIPLLSTIMFSAEAPKTVWTVWAQLPLPVGFRGASRPLVETTQSHQPALLADQAELGWPLNMQRLGCCEGGPTDTGVSSP